MGSAKSFLQALAPSPLDQFPCSLVWLGLALPRVEALCWLAVPGKVLTKENLRRKDS